MSSPIRQRAAKAAMQWRARFGSQSSAAGLPEPVGRRMQESFVSYWTRRIDQHSEDSWAGVPMLKFPEDLRVYQHLLWMSRADTVIEIGAKWGGSLLWFRDQLRTFEGYGRLEGRPTVIGVDLATDHAVTVLDREHPTWREQITLIEGDLREQATIERIKAELPTDARPLIVEDAAHTGEITRLALDSLAHLVRPGGFFVVEDGHVDIPELHPDGPPEIKQLGIQTGGVLPAIEDWLGTPNGTEFTVRADLELYGVTSHPGGFLQRGEGERPPG